MSSGPPSDHQGRGWHADPFGRHRQRWWDGTRWTEQTQPKGGAMPGAVPGAMPGAVPGAMPGGIPMGAQEADDATKANAVELQARAMRLMYGPHAAGDAAETPSPAPQG